MKLLLLFVLLSAIVVGCKKDDDPDIGVDQVWFDKTVADLEKSNIKEYFYIVKGEYEGKCVMFVNNCCPMCLTAITVYNCNGTILDDVDLTKIKNVTIIWKPDNFACNQN